MRETCEQGWDNRETLSNIQSGNWLYLPDLTDPNVMDPNEALFEFTGQPSGLIDTRDFFRNLSPEVLTNFAPPKVVESFGILQAALDTASQPSDVFTRKDLYPHYLRFHIFMTTGKYATPEDMMHHSKTIRTMNIPREDLMVTVPAAVIGFALTDRQGGKDGVNMRSDFAAFLDQLITGDMKGIFSPLCAQYGTQIQGNGRIFAYKLQEHVAQNQARRTVDWLSMLTFTQRLKGRSPQIVWSTLVGDSDHVHSIVPKVIRQYATEDGLVRMLMLIDRHFNELSNLAQQSEADMFVTNLQHIERQTEELLSRYYGSDWYSLDNRALDVLEGRLERNEDHLDPDGRVLLQLTRIALYEAYPAISRFMGDNKITPGLFERKAENLQDDLAGLNDWEFEEWMINRGFTQIEEAQDFLRSIRSRLIHQGSMTTGGDAVHEVMLYFLMGKFAAEQGWGVVGLDIDHDGWMNHAWGLGYNAGRSMPQNTAAPILYARSPDTGKTDASLVGGTIADVYKSQQYNKDGVQLLSSIPLREYFAL